MRSKPPPALFTRRWTFGRRHLSYYLVLADGSLRRSLLKSLLLLDDFDLVICETPHDAEVLTVATRARTLYDCPTPWADELYFEDRLTERQHQQLRLREAALFESVDYLSFFGNRTRGTPSNGTASTIAISSR
jgi:hypothetical protein